VGFSCTKANSKPILVQVSTTPVPAHLDPMGVVREPVEDAVGQRGIADLFVPA
jgi:hypothetical protein